MLPDWGTGAGRRKLNWKLICLKTEPSYLNLQTWDEGHVDKVPVGGQRRTTSHPKDCKKRHQLVQSWNCNLKWINEVRTIYFLQWRKFLPEVSLSHIPVNLQEGCSTPHPREASWRLTGTLSVCGNPGDSRTPFSGLSQQHIMRGPYRGWSEHLFGFRFRFKLFFVCPTGKPSSPSDGIIPIVMLHI